MTTGELIAELQKYPPENKVFAKRAALPPRNIVPSISEHEKRERDLSHDIRTVIGTHEGVVRNYEYLVDEEGRLDGVQDLGDEPGVYIEFGGRGE